VLSINRDITERKAAEAALRESERKSRAIFDQTFQFIGLMTPDGTLIEANRTSMSFAGIEESDVLGRPFWETPWWTHSPELQDRLRDAVREAAAGQFVRFEATHPAADGTHHILDFSLKPVTDESGNVVFLIPEGRDITERKRAEAELARHRDHLEQLVAERTEQLVQSARFATIGRLASGVGHEINNPLQGILSHLGTVKAGLSDEKANESVEVIRVAVKRIAGVVKQLRELHQSHGQKRKRIDVNAIVRDTARLFQAPLRELSIRINQELADESPKALGAEAGLHQVLANLVLNAQDAMPDGGRLTLATRIVDQSVEITVADTGHGIAEDFLPRVFEPFVTTKSPGKGTGLGLAIAKGAIDGMGGELSAESVTGRGAKFTILLPRAP